MEKKVCIICNELLESIPSKCSKCGFSNEDKYFLNREQYDEWIKSIVNPYRRFWDEKKLIERLRKSCSVDELRGLSPFREHVLHLRGYTDDDIQQEIVGLLKRHGGLYILEIECLLRKAHVVGFVHRVISHMISQGIVEYRSYKLCLLVEPSDWKYEPWLSGDEIKRNIIDMLKTMGNMGLQEDYIVSQLRKKGKVNDRTFKSVVIQLIEQRAVDFCDGRLFLK